MQIRMWFDENVIEIFSGNSSRIFISIDRMRLTAVKLKCLILRINVNRWLRIYVPLEFRWRSNKVLHVTENC